VLEKGMRRRRKREGLVFDMAGLKNKDVDDVRIEVENDNVIAN